MPGITRGGLGMKDKKACSQKDTSRGRKGGSFMHFGALRSHSSQRGKSKSGQNMGHRNRVHAGFGKR